jgi:two-component system, sensor histidine kinase and response regulator
MTNTSTRKETLLIVDDMPNNMAVLFKFLTNAGFSVIIAQDGEDGLQTAELAHPDLILLDVMMPGMDGFEVCRRLKAQPNTQEIPIIFMTALTETVNKVTGFQLGAADYLTKPLQHEEVLARVKAHLNIYKLQRQLVAQKCQVEEQNQRLNEEIATRKLVEASLQCTTDLLTERTSELEKRNAELNSFSRMVAHDLKSPVGGIFNLLEIIKSQCEKGTLVTKQQIEWINKIAQLSQKVLKIIDALLLLAGIAGRQEVVIHPLSNMSLLIHQVLKQRLADQLTQCSGEVVIADHFPLAVGYAPWVEEIWVNYLSNGLKYGGQPPRLEVGADEIPPDSPAKEEVEGNRSEGGKEGGLIRFWVRDNGQGLSPEMQNKLFIAFTRLHKHSEGQGLGLSIVRQIVEKLGGTVGVESEVGQGSVFYFTLPAHRDNPEG